MEEKTQQQSVERELNYKDSIIAKIVGQTMLTIPGVLSVEGNLIEEFADRFRDHDDPTKGIKISLDDDHKTADIELSAVLEYGRNAPKIFDEAINRVQMEMKRMTDIELKGFKLTVTDLLTKPEWEEQQAKHKQDKQPETMPQPDQNN